MSAKRKTVVTSKRNILTTLEKLDKSKLLENFGRVQIRPTNSGMK